MLHWQRGSRPGDPLAALLYGFSLSAMHKIIDDALPEKGLLPVMPCPSGPALAELKCAAVTLGSAAWADDCMRHVEADTLQKVLERSSGTLRICFERTTSMGVEFSQGAAKTAVLMSVLHEDRGSRRLLPASQRYCMLPML